MTTEDSTMAKTLTDEERERLREKLEAIHKVRATLMVARRPLDDAIKALDELHDAAVEEAGVELLDEACETCERLLIVGDLGHRAADGPVMCESCSPTYADVLAQYEDAEDRPTLADLDVTAGEFEEMVADLKERVAAGKGDHKVVVPL